MLNIFKRKKNSKSKTQLTSLISNIDSHVDKSTRDDNKTSSLLRFRLVGRSNLKTKKLLRAFIFLSLIFLIVGAAFFFLTKSSGNKAEAGWFNDNWTYRQKIVVTNNTTAETDVYISFDAADVLDTSDTSKFQADCDDIRFTTQSGELLSYYIVSGCSSASTDIDVLLPSFPAGEQSFYMYYGNSITNGVASSSAFSTEASNYTIGTPATEEVGPGPIAYWKFDEGVDNSCTDGTSDMCDSIGDNDGTNTNVTWVSEDQCVSGKCLYFDGSTSWVESIVAPNVPTSPNQFTIMGYIKPGDATSRFITPSSNGIDQWVGYDPTNERLHLEITELADTNGRSRYSSNNSVPLNRWTHFAVTIDDKDIKIYINGALDSSYTETIDIGGWTGFWRIGQRGNSTNWFLGYLDELKVYPYARSANEIKEDFNKGGVVLAADTSYLSNGLVGYWRMDDAGIDAEGEISTDSSGNGNDGTLYGDNSTGDNGTGMDCTVAGKFGTGCDFDGVDDYVGISSLTDVGDEFTASMWFNVDAYPGTEHAFIGATQGVNTLYGMVSNTGIVYFRTASSSTFSNLSSNTTITTGNWHHITLIRDSSGRKIYIDGELANQDNSTLWTTTIGSLSFGMRIGSSLPFDGKVDEIRIYNRALTSAEVRGLYEWAPGPVLHLPMDDNVSGDSQTIYDISGYGNSGTTAYGANTTGMDCTISGQYGGGCEFDGTDDRITISDDPTISGLNAVSFAAWINMGTYETGSTYEALFSKGNYAGLREYRFRVESGNTWVWHVSSDGNDPGASEATVGASSIPVGEWTHVAGTYDSETDELVLYVNGSVVDTATYTSSGLYDGSANLGIAGYGDTANLAYHLDAKIDDFRVYNYALSPKQITNIMNAREVSASAVGSPLSSPVGHWSFDEGYGTTAYDSGSGDNDGTITGAAWSKSGKLGAALDFNGTSDFVDVGDVSILDGSTQATFSAWINTTAFVSDSAIVRKWIAGDQAYSLGMGTAVGGEDLRLLISDGTNGRAWDTGANALEDYSGEWVHVVGVWEGGDDATFYINGLPFDVGSTAVISGTGTPSSIYNSADILAIGARSDGGVEDKYFDGYLDEVKIYNYALTADEVKLDYNQGKGLVFGSTSTASDGAAPSNSNDRSYCVPGDTSTCTPPEIELTFDQQKVSGNAQTVYDTSGNGNNGTTYYGANTTGMDCTVSGAVGVGCDFDNVDDYIDIGDVFYSDTLTMCAWIYPKSIDGSDTVLIKRNSSGVTDGGSGSSEWHLFLSDSDTIGLNAYDSSSTNVTGNLTADAPSSMVGTWTHVCGVLGGSGNTDAIYINGAQANTATQSNTIRDTSTLIQIAARSANNNSRYFDGIIDQVRIYDYARTSAQIAWEYNKGAPIAWYKFDECQGTTINDWSSNGLGDYNGNHGTLTIAGAGTNTSPGTCNSGDTSEAWNNGTNGKYGASMDFDGGDDDYIQVTGSFDFAENAPRSYALWVKFDTSPNWWVPFSPQARNVGSLQFLGTARLDTRICSEGTSSKYASLTWTDDYLNQWMHLAAAYDSVTDTVYFYKDGEIIDQTDLLGTGCEAWLSSRNIIIGARTATPDSEFDGQIDDVRIYNYALTPEQVKTVMNQGSAVSFE